MEYEHRRKVFRKLRKDYDNFELSKDGIHVIENSTVFGDKKLLLDCYIRQGKNLRIIQLVEDNKQLYYLSEYISLLAKRKSL